MKYAYGFFGGCGAAALGSSLISSPGGAWTLGTTLLVGVTLAIILRA